MDKKISTLVGTAIIIILAFAVGYFVWLTQKNNPIETQIPVVRINPTKKSDVLAQPTDEMANWQTYKNDKYGFEVRYPESYSIFNTSGDSRISFRLTEACKSLVSGGGEWPIDCQAYDVLVQQNGIGIAGDTSKTFVAGIQAEKFTDSNGMWSNGTQVLVQFQKGQNWYIQTFTFNQGKSQIAEGVMNQILSTFKFTDIKADETANWQTYINEKYGFEFKYPNNWKILEQDFNPASDFLKKITVTNNNFLTLVDLDTPNRKASQGELIYSIDFRKHSNEERYQTNVKKIKINSNDNFDAYFIDDFRNTGKNEFDQILSTFKFTK